MNLFIQTFLILSSIGIYFNKKPIILNTYYEYIDFTHPEDGQPSKCDCDYKKIGLHLNKDFSFKLTKQKGRLEIISYEELKGTWQVETSEKLQLKVSSSFKKLGFSPDNPIRENFDQPYGIVLDIDDKQLIFEGNKTMHPGGKTFNTTINE